jgi:hypothetical protein
MFVLDNDDSESDINRPTTFDLYEKDEFLFLSNFIDKLDIHTDIIVVKPYLPIRTCTTVVAYANLSQTHMIKVNNYIDKSISMRQRRFVFISGSTFDNVERRMHN